MTPPPGHLTSIGAEAGAAWLMPVGLMRFRVMMCFMLAPFHPFDKTKLRLS
jgi:hypothetical protein